MASEPSILAYIAISIFFTALVGVFAMIVAGTGGGAAFVAVLGFLAAFSTIHLLATNALIRNWLRYAAAEDPFDPPGDDPGGDGADADE